MAGQSGAGRPDERMSAVVAHVTRDRVGLYADRVASPEAIHVRRIRAQAETLATPGLVRFGRAPIRRAARPRRAVAAVTLAATAMLGGGSVALAASVHRVEDGDTLSELAEHYGTSVDALVQLNRIADPDLIVVGDELVINPDVEAVEPEIDVPAADETTSDDDVLPAGIYVVEPGDTLTSLAERFGTTVDMLASLNDLADPDIIVVGDPLVLPFAGEPEDTIGPGADDSADGDDGVTTPTDDTADDGTTPDSETEDDETGDGGATPIDVSTPVEVDGASLHLVSAGETLESIAAQYGIDPDALLAANEHARAGISPGMILSVPSASSVGVQLAGVPVRTASLALSGEAAAVSVATGYWAAEIPEADVLAELPSAENPHEGFRGDVNGAWGGTDDYGVYAEPLATILERYGFHAGVFYGEGDATTLLAQLDAGIPVIVWMTDDAAVSEPFLAGDGVSEFKLVPGKQAVVAYGYDDNGVFIVDVADGAYRHVSWDDFMRSWGYFDGMALAVVPL